MKINVIKYYPKGSNDSYVRKLAAKRSKKAKKTVSLSSIIDEAVEVHKLTTKE